MGLDHGLKGRLYLSSYDDKQKVFTDKLNAIFPEIEVDVEEVCFDILTLRKANAVHNWFVQNVQDGADNCDNYRVTTDHLTELLSLCTKARFGDHDSLPTTSGFFFGDTDYGEWYQETIVQTIHGINAALKFLKSDQPGWKSLYYWSSW